jgi:hypothetical protein
VSVTKSLLPPPTAEEIADYLRGRIAKNEKEVDVGQREKLKSHERMCSRTMQELKVVIAWIEHRT